MFQYTSETIINSAVGALANGTKRWDVVNGVLIIDGVTAVKVSDIKAVYHTPYMKEEIAEAKLTLTDAQVSALLTAGVEYLRLRIYLTEQGRSSSIMQNAYLHKAKPFTYEVALESGDTAKKVMDKFADLIKKEMAQTDFKFFSAASVAGSGAADLTLKAADCYLRFADERGVVVPVGGATAVIGKVNVATLTAEESFVPVVKGAVVKFGSQGAGTVARLVKDLRIPTAAKVDPFELKDGGMPVPGGKYDQYLIEVVTDRRHISGGVVGELGKSLTSFILFIESAAKSSFDTLLSGASITPVEAGVPVASEVASGRRPAADSDAAAEVYVASNGEVVKNK